MNSLHDDRATRAVPSLLLCTIMLLFTGCMSSRYQPAKHASAATPVSLGSAAGNVTAAVHAVIVCHGQGSWKRDAYWDEYGVSVTNRTGAPITLQSVSLTGFAGESWEAGTDPWQLEKLSQTQAERNFGLAKNTAIHIGGGITTVAAGAGIGALTAGSGGVIVSATALGAALGAVVAIPVFGGATVYRNVHGRHEIRKEFDRRRLSLPATLVAGETRDGSLFFPITPGPKTLYFAAKNYAGNEISAVIDLSPIGTLHLAEANKE